MKIFGSTAKKNLIYLGGKKRSKILPYKIKDTENVNNHPIKVINTDHG